MHTAFNEAQWLKLVYLLADTQQWLNDLCSQAFMQLPLPNKKKLFTQNYYLTPAALTHIIERHYYLVSRHPQCGKFHIPVLEILHYIREAATQEPRPVPGNCNSYRTLQADRPLGFDADGNPSSILTVITGPNGHIITAFPGEL